MAKLTNLYDPKTWQVRDTMAWWSDGTSNQLIVGEKHIYISNLGKCNQSWGNDERAWQAGDCSYVTSGHWPSVGSARGIVRGDDMDTAVVFPIRRPKETAGLYYQQSAFGSWHPGVCQFAVGDGSVRAVPVTVSLTVYGALGHVKDGRAVSLP